MTVLEVTVFLLVAAAGTAVVLTRNPVNQAIVASFYGLVLGIMFLVYQAPDVALSQILHPHLSWRLWQPGDVLIKGGFGVREPGPDAPEVFPSALLVPLVAFDRRGGRVGYG